MRIRPERVAHLMRREVSDVLRNRMRDPRLGLSVTVTDVEVTSDLSFARIFVTVMGDVAQRQHAMSALAKATGFVRHELRDRLDLREIPEVRFEYDTSLDRGARVDELLRRIERGTPPEDEELP